MPKPASAITFVVTGQPQDASEAGVLRGASAAGTAAAAPAALPGRVKASVRVAARRVD